MIRACPCTPLLSLASTLALAQDSPFEEEARKSYVGRFKSVKGEVDLAGHVVLNPTSVPGVMRF